MKRESLYLMAVGSVILWLATLLFFPMGIVSVAIIVLFFGLALFLVLETKGGVKILQKHRKEFTNLILIVSLAFFASGCALGVTRVNVTHDESSFKIAAGEVKTVYVEKEGEKYKIVRVEDGEKKEKGTIVFRYIYEPSMQRLVVESHVEEPFITYDCFQILGNKARKTSIIGATKDVPTIEMWSDGIKLLLIENIRVAREGDA